MRHQDRKGIGNALTKKEHREDVKLIREIGANTVRLAHYQQSQEFYDLCDEYSIIVRAEIPYITSHMPSGRENTLSQMRELIAQCYNHPSIVCWGLSNEIAASGALTDDLMENHRLLNELCHRKEPFVRLCQKGYIKRTGSVAKIKVYSNLHEVTLLLDGKEIGKKSGRRVFEFSLPISSVHFIGAKAGDVCDSTRIEKASEPEPSYIFGKEEIVNRFERGDYDESCYSIRDTMGELSKNPKTAAIVERLMQQARASRGDVAGTAAKNANLERMMTVMTLESLLKQVGPAISPEQIKSLNQALQGIKK